MGIDKKYLYQYSGIAHYLLHSWQHLWLLLSFPLGRSIPCISTLAIFYSYERCKLIAPTMCLKQLKLNSLVQLLIMGIFLDSWSISACVLELLSFDMKAKSLLSWIWTEPFKVRRVTRSKQTHDERLSARCALNTNRGGSEYFDDDLQQEREKAGEVN